MFEDKSSTSNEDSLPEVSKYLECKQLQLTTDEDILASGQRMKDRRALWQAGGMTLDNWNKWQQATGITSNADTILGSEALQGLLKPCAHWVHDWLRCLLSNGIFAIGMFLLLSILDTWPTLQGYVGMWTLPKHISNLKPKDLFDRARVKKRKSSQKMNLAASDLLSPESILNHFVLTVCLPAGSHLDACHAYSALAVVVQKFQYMTLGMVDADALQAQIEKALALWCKAGWEEWMIKKHHVLLHFPAHLRLRGMCTGCFAPERKRKDVSKHGANMFNLQHFERGVLEEVLSQEFHALAETSALSNEVCLVKPHPLAKRLMHIPQGIWPWCQTAWTGHALKLPHGASVSKGDIVLLDGKKAGRVQLHVRTGWEYFSLVDVFTLLEWHSSYALWSEDNNDGVAVVPAKILQTSMVWCKAQRGIKTLIPWPWM